MCLGGHSKCLHFCQFRRSHCFQVKFTSTGLSQYCQKFITLGPMTINITHTIFRADFESYDEQFPLEFLRSSMPARSKTLSVITIECNLMTDTMQNNVTTTINTKTTSNYRIRINTHIPYTHSLTIYAHITTHSEGAATSTGTNSSVLVPAPSHPRHRCCCLVSS